MHIDYVIIISIDRKMGEIQMVYFGRDRDLVCSRSLASLGGLVNSLLFRQAYWDIYSVCKLN